MLQIPDDDDCNGMMMMMMMMVMMMVMMTVLMMTMMVMMTVMMTVMVIPSMVRTGMGFPRSSTSSTTEGTQAPGFSRGAGSGLSQVKTIAIIPNLLDVLVTVRST